MTRIKIGENEGHFFIEAKGHATGSEKVCSGISAILFALAGWLENADKNRTACTVRLNPGDACISFFGGVEAQTAFDMAAIGLMQIEKAHPEYIEIVIV